MSTIRRNRTRLAAVAVTTITALALGACGSSSQSSGDKNGGKPTSGGTLTFYDPVQFTAWTTGNSIWSNSQVSDNIGERLIWQDPKTGEFKPWLATSWEISPDHLTYTFHLKQGVTFTDGTPLTAQVVKDNFDQHGLGDAKLGIPVDQFWNGYVGTTVVDPQTFKIQLKTPDAGFLQVLSNYRASTILAESYVKRDLAGQSQIQNWVGTGPFQYASGDGVNEVVLKRRTGYTSAPGGSSHTGDAYLDKIDFKYVPEESTRIGALQSGTAQIARNLSPTDEKTVSSFGGNLVAIPIHGETNKLAFQLKPNRPQDDLAVRQALLAATDIKQINSTVLTPNYQVPIGPLVGGTPYAPNESQYLTYDLNKANSLLENDGWKLGADGYRSKNGQKLKFDIWIAPYYQVSEPVLELLQSQWKKAGVDLEIHSASLTQYTAIQAAGGQGSATWDFTQGQTSSADPNVLRVSYDTTRGNGLDQDKTHPQDPKLNQLVDAQAEQFTTAGRTAAVKAVGDYLFQQAYIIPLYDETQVFGLAPTVHGFGTESTGRSWVYDTWLSK